MARRTKKELLILKEKALNLVSANPTLPMSVIAEHFNVSVSLVSKWFDEAGLKKWFKGDM